jgi:predicted nucleic acid-binding protein
VRLVADANVLLACVLGGRATLVLSHSSVEEIFTTESTLAEVQEYAAVLARSRKLPLDTLLLAVAALPVSLAEPEIYAHKQAQARKLVGMRDPDDIEILALALHLKLPLWSNDNDFEDSGIEQYTTAELLKKLGISKSR